VDDLVIELPLYRCGTCEAYLQTVPNPFRAEPSGRLT
jgi:hypothetical protein